jgi:hypothetical protein
MTRSRSGTALLALVAVFALSALATASASAEITVPQFKPVGTKTLPVSFTLTAGSMEVSLGGIGPLPCSKATGTGSITGPKSGTAKLQITGCRNAQGEACESPEAKETGEIITGSLPFVLVYTTKEPTKQVALDFGSKTGTFMSYGCRGSSAVLRGRILAPITPLNTLTKTFTATLRQEKGEETPTKNYNEALTGTEESFPELNWDGGGFLRGGYLTGNLSLSKFEQNEKATEEKIEA